MRTRGLALLVVVGILGVLMLLAVAFVAMARLERKASQQRLYATKALLLARSGLEDARARLSAGQSSSLPQTAYAGEDLNANGFPDLGLETSETTLEPYMMNILDCPPGQSLRPSFYCADGALPALERVGGRQRGYSGRLGSSLSYALKVEDESAKINVNGGFLDDLDRDADGIPDHRDPDVRRNLPAPKDTGRGWNRQLARILNLLGSRAGVGDTALGQDILEHRPLGGYRSIAQLQQIIHRSTPDYSPYLTTSSWVDATVVHPNGYKYQDAGASQPAMNRVKTGRSPLLPEENGRPPVNLNAASRPILLSLLRDLEGVSCEEEGFPGRVVLDSVTADGVADAILAARRTAPFTSWGQFSAFVDGLVASGVIQGFNHPVGTVFGNGSVASFGGNLAVADLIKANFDPNTMLMKSLPDQLMFRWVDKSDLTQWSTEGSLGPTGNFRISAAGRVLGPEGSLLAEAALTEAVQVFSLSRQTTQKDFVGGRQPQDDPLSYLSLSTDPLNRATGAGASWNTFKPGTGLGAITYPSPMTALPGNAADFDGCVGLATLEEDAANPSGGTLTFLHRFDNGWTADFGARPELAPATTPPSWAKLQLDPSVSPWPAQPGVEPNTLCPDGAHLQHERSPGYLAEGNFPAATMTTVVMGEDDDGNPLTGDVPINHFAVSYWVKPKGNIPDDPGEGRRWCVSVDVDLGRFDPANVALSQMFMIGRSSPYGWGILMENSMDSSTGGSDGGGMERQFRVNRRFGVGQALLPDLRWHLVTTLVNTNQGGTLALPRDLCLDVRGMDAPGTATNVPSYMRWNQVLSEDILTSGSVMILGIRQLDVGDLSRERMTDQVLDELAICDFGTAGPAGLASLRAWAGTRAARGRYYKKDDASFLSTVISPAGGTPATLLNAWWTEYLPSEIRQELLESPGNVPASGQPRAVDHSLDGARLELELLDPAAQTLGSLSQGGRIGRSLGRFRYRVRFRTGLSDPLNQGVLETPFFDDITFLWQPAGGPRALSWERP